jgi:hypothetical protein
MPASSTGYLIPSNLVSGVSIVWAIVEDSRKVRHEYESEEMNRTLDTSHATGAGWCNARAAHRLNHCLIGNGR